MMKICIAAGDDQSGDINADYCLHLEMWGEYSGVSVLIMQAAGLGGEPPGLTDHIGLHLTAVI